jgi:uncharacterized protein (DUF934 family)
MSYYDVRIVEDWSDDTYDTLAARSHAFYKNKHVLPVAAWVAECKNDTIRAAEVVRGLGGRLAPNRALEALERLRDGEVMRELPFPGRPHARVFQRRHSLFWGVALEFAAEAGRGTVPAASPSPSPSDASQRQ